MLFPTRYRSRYDGGFRKGGRATSLGPPLGDFSQGDYYRLIEDMWDTEGYRDESNYLFKMTRCNTVGYFSGQGSHYYTTSQWAIADYWYFWDLTNITNQPSDNNAALMTLARTNPSRPALDVPVFIKELRDIPRMLKHIGNRIQRGSKGARRLIKDYTAEMAAEDSLALQFGWAPLVSDLIKVLDFQESVNQRMNEIDRLYNGNTHLKRKVTVYRENVDKGKRAHFCGPPYSAQTRVIVQYEQEALKWGSVRWLPSTAPEFSSDDEQLDYAKKLVTGLKGDISPSTVWNGLPWSWMLDWFGATGDFLEAHRNTVPVQHEDLNIMESHGILAKSFAWESNQWDASFVLDGYPLVGYKSRIPLIGIPNPDVRLPFLNGRQLSILAPLAIQSFGRRR